MLWAMSEQNFFAQCSDAEAQTTIHITATIQRQHVCYNNDDTE